MGCSDSSEVTPQYPQSFYRKPNVFFALGGPGSCKGQYCELLVREYRLKYLSMKELVALEVAKETSLSREIKTCLTKGELIPSDTITIVLKKAVAMMGPCNFIVDGYPRNMDNVHSFEALLRDQVNLHAVLYFDCSEQKMYQKIKRDGNNLPDSKINQLMSIYEDEVLPVVRHFALKDILIRINTQLHPTIQQNYEEVKTGLKLFGVDPCQAAKIMHITGSLNNRLDLCRSISRRYSMCRISLPLLYKSILITPNDKDWDVMNRCQLSGQKVPISLKYKLVKRQLDKKSHMANFQIEGLLEDDQDYREWKKKDDNIDDVLLLELNNEQQNGLKEEFKQAYIFIKTDKSDDACLEMCDTQLMQFNIQPYVKKSRSPKVMMIVGVPGSGKGSQCERLRRDFGFEYVSTAELLRNQINKRRLHAQLIESYIHSGRLVPSELLVRLIKRHVFQNRSGAKLPLILDGFPRNIENMQSWQDDVGEEIELLQILYFDCDEATMKERLVNTKNSRKLSDNPTTIIKRFLQYVKDTEPVIEYYSKLGVVTKIDSKRPIEIVYGDVKKKMSEFGYRCLNQTN